MNEKSQVVLSSDSDLAALAGNRCLGIKSFKYNDKNKSECISLMVLYTPSSETLTEVSTSIFINENSKRIKKSSYAVFDYINDIEIRGLLAVGLGCDVYLTGIENLGKSALKKYVDQEQNLTYNNI